MINMFRKLKGKIKERICEYNLLMFYNVYSLINVVHVNPSLIQKDYREVQLYMITHDLYFTRDSTMIE